MPHSINRLLACVWVAIIGTNVAAYYSEVSPYESAVILAGAAYFLFVFRAELARLIVFADFLLALAILVIPILLMLLSDRSFERGTYTSLMATALVFVIAAVLAVRRELTAPLAFAAFSIVAVGATLNLYELFVENNVWSAAPGRSAGFYLNPNISAEALVGYGLAFLLMRMKKLGIPDLMLVSLVVLGTFATFSRAGILACLVLLPVAALMRVNRRHLPRAMLGAVAISFLAVVFASHVLTSLDLSDDAMMRVLSLIEEGGIGDYEQDRGSTALASFELAMEHPLTGAGVGTIYAIWQGPHNMFLAMLLDYGLIGLAAYLTLIARLVLMARRTGRDVSGTILLYVAWLLVFGFASHNLLGNTVTIPLLGFALARAFQIERFRKSRPVPLTEREASRAVIP
jgi:O-antigen ligase